MSSTTPTAASRVFAISELLENILLQLQDEPDSHHQPPTIQLFTLQRISRNFQGVILGSKALQAEMWALQTCPTAIIKNSLLNDFIGFFGPQIQRELERARASDGIEYRGQSWVKIRAGVLRPPCDRINATFGRRAPVMFEQLDINSATSLGVILDCAKWGDRWAKIRGID